MHDFSGGLVLGDSKAEQNVSAESAKGKLIEVATKLFANFGYDGTSTRDIAKEAGLNISLISYYFNGKEGLYKAVINDFALKAQSESQKALHNVDVENLSREDFSQLMRGLLSRIIPMKFASRDIQRLLHREMLSGLPYAKDIYEGIFSNILKRIVGLYEKGQEKGYIRKDINPYIVFFSMVHSVDQYIVMSCQCKTSVQKSLYTLPDEMENYIDQLYIIFVEGVLL